MRCLRIYAHLSFNGLYNANGFATESVSKIVATVGSPLLPTYILDMIREICRPMYTDAGYSVLAYFPANDQGFGPCYGLGWNTTDVFISSQLTHKIKDFCSPLVQENPGKVPIFISTNRHFGYANGSTCPVFRMESMNRLRFLPPFTTFYLGFRKFNRSIPGLVEEANSMRMSAFVPTERGFPDRDELVKSKYDERDQFFDAKGDVFCIPYDIKDGFFSPYCDPAAIVPLAAEGALRPEPVFGLVTREEFQEFLKKFCLSDAILANPSLFRSRFNFGLGFRFDVEYLATLQFARFPSNSNPSKVTLGMSKPQVTGKGKNKNKNKNKKEIRLGDSEIEVDKG